MRPCACRASCSDWAQCDGLYLGRGGGLKAPRGFFLDSEPTFCSFHGNCQIVSALCNALNRIREVQPMLILSRRPGESVKIGDEVTVKVLGIRGVQVRIGFEAPQDVAVHREEV